MSWNIQKVEDFTDVITGGTPSTNRKEYWEGGSIPWLNSGDLNKDSIHEVSNFITEEGLSNSAAKLMPPNTVLIALTGTTTGVVGYLHIEASANQSVTGILPSKSHHPKYLYYYLKSIRQKILNDSYGGAQKHISQGYVKDLQIPLPPLPIQKRIAEILDAADALRKKDQELLKKYDELAQAIFIDMFGDPVKNEKGWEVKRLGEILEIDAKGIDPTELNEYNYIGLEHIEKETGKILVIDKGNVVSNKFIFTKEHILYGKLRPYLNKVAAPNFDGICSTDIFPLKPKNKLLKQFLISILRSKDFVSYSNTNAVGANLPRANKDIILNYKTIAPDFATATEFSNNIHSIILQKEKVEDKIIRSEILFNSIIQKAFSGELVS